MTNKELAYIFLETLYEQDKDENYKHYSLNAVGKTYGKDYVQIRSAADFLKVNGLVDIIYLSTGGILGKLTNNGKIFYDDLKDKLNNLNHCLK